MLYESCNTLWIHIPRMLHESQILNYCAIYLYIISTLTYDMSDLFCIYYILYHECSQDMELYPPKGFHIRLG